MMTDQTVESTVELDEQSLVTLVSDRPSTPDKCAVCLNNKQIDAVAKINSCSHTFCYSCILEWSKVRAICPLCKQPFSLITQERFSGDIVEEFRVQTPQRPPTTTLNNISEVLNWFDQRNTRSNNNESHSDIFRQMVYIEWLSTIQAIVRRPNHSTRNSSLSSLTRSSNATSSWSNIIPLDSVRRLLHRYLHQTTSDLRESTIYSQATRQTVAFRKYIYINKLFVRSPLIGQNHDTLTVRECSPTWYASNPACLHRLVPFLARELLALLWNDEPTIEHIIQEILTTIQLHEIHSNYMSRKLNEYLGRYTKHFIHEFHTFARCPYDLAGFDRYAQYLTMNPSSQTQPPMEISLYDDDDDNDNDNNNNNNNNNNNRGNEQTPIIIDETSDVSIHTIDIASSSSSSSSSSFSSSSSRIVNEFEDRSSSPECEILDYIEPIRERTPTLIVLSEDDENVESESQVTSTKRRKNHHHQKQSKRQQTISTKTVQTPTSVIVDDDIDNDSQVTNHSIQEQLQEVNERS